MKKDDFIFLYAIGKGFFGKVWKAKYIKTNNFLAIKQMSKTKIIDQNAERSVMQERLFLSYLKNKFIVNMICSFQDTNSLYLGLELMKGGDLRYHLINNTQTFTESQLKFLLSNLILGIEYIHSQNIIHRDIKPENILFDNKGYAYITDFNISCKREDINNNKDVSGTPVYMAPETINLKEQDFSIDFYSLGIICYECIMGQRPYEGNSRHEVKEILNDNNFEIEQDERISIECRNLINGLLSKDPNSRLGAQSGASELKENLFFQGFNWDLLSRKKYVSPLIEIINFSRAKSGIADELFDQEYCNKTEEIDENTKVRYSQIISHENYPNYFRQYTYLCKDAVIDIINKNRENGAAPPKKTLSSCRSSENINLPKLSMKKSVSQKSITISNGGSYHHNHHNNNSRYSTKNKKVYVHSKHNNRLPSLRSNDSLRSYYEYKLNKYKNLLRNKSNMGYDDYPNIPIYNNNSMIPYPNFNNMYSPPRFGGGGGDIYNDVCNGLQRKLYRDIFGGMEDDYNDNRGGFRGGGRNLPNQYQINNYFPPTYMMPGMGMPNPYFGMMNPYPNNNGFFLPNIYDKDKHRHKHHHKHKSSQYSKSSYTNSSSKYHKSSKVSESTTNNKKKTKKSEETNKSNKKKDKKKEKKKETKNEEEEEDEGEENEEEEEEDSKKKKKKKGDDDEDEENEGEENEDDEDNEGEENEDDEEEDSKKKKKKKKGDDDDDEDNDEEDNEDEDKEDDDDEDSKKKKKKKGSDGDEDNDDEGGEGEEKEDDEDGDGDGDGDDE